MCDSNLVDVTAQWHVFIITSRAHLALVDYVASSEISKFKAKSMWALFGIMNTCHWPPPPHTRGGQ